MNKFGVSATALLASTALVQAGGIERNATTTGILFEDGHLRGTGIRQCLAGRIGHHQRAAGQFGDMTPSYSTVSLGLSPRHK